MERAIAKSIVEAWPTVLRASKQQSRLYCHPADDVLLIFPLSGSVIKDIERDQECVSIIICVVPYRSGCCHGI